MNNSLLAEAHTLRVIANDLPPTYNQNAYDEEANYPFIVGQNKKMYVGDWQGYHYGIFVNNRDTLDENALPIYKGRYNPFRNQYHLYYGTQGTPELDQLLHKTFNSPDSPYTDHL